MDQERIVAEIVPEMAVYVAHDLARKFGDKVRIRYTDRIVEVEAAYIPVEIETWLACCEHVRSTRLQELYEANQEAS